MKFYVGPNKKKSREVSKIKAVYMILCDLENSRVELDLDKFSDNSSEWVQIRKKIKDGVIDVVISSDPKENEVTDLEVYKTKYVLDEGNSKRLT